MKKPTETWRHWHEVRARDESKRRLERRQPPLVTLTRDGRTYHAFARPKAYVPESFELFTNTEVVVKFLDGLRYSLLVITPRRRQIYETKRRNDPYRPAGKPRRIGQYISFDRMQSVDPAGALVLASEFDRVRQRLNARLPAVNVDRWDPSVREMLDGLGFFRLLEIGSSPPPMISMADQKGEWRLHPFATGRKVESAVAGRLQEEIASVLNIAVPELRRDEKMSQLFRSVIDSMSNVLEHAYPDVPYLFPHVSRWWLTGAADPVNGRLTISLYDQGVTIPGSLESNVGAINPSAKRAIGRMVKRGSPDSDLVEFAVDHHVTTTGDEQRGRGLGKLREFVDCCTQGEMRIISRRGVYHYVRGRPPQKRDLSSSIGGTLISWEVTL